jgi:hypothetical protein
MKRINLFSMLSLLLVLFSCSDKEETVIAPQWQEVIISFNSQVEYTNPYTDVDMWVEFVHVNGDKITRPAYWDGESIWKVSFASPLDEGVWNFTTYCSDETNAGLHGVIGHVRCAPYEGKNQLVKNGLLRMSSGKRTVVHANGRPFLVVGDTPWALPFRGTTESAGIYAKDRQDKGFNVALLMTLQPDKGATGPRDRISDGGFDVAFEDLVDGHLTKINISYYQYLDSLVQILLDHEIVPVYQPVFHGFGWKGLDLLGWDMDPAEYTRYCRYLVARYGAKHAIWLVSGDSHGRDKGVIEGGEEIEKWDAYAQPTGLHYSPFDSYAPEWWNKDKKEEYVPHYNRINQEADWLDFQWCQTGHDGKHIPHKVFQMYDNQPSKAVLNGEPTYEAMQNPEKAAGWWQGHEAWLNFTSGGTMGHVYGAAGLWQWKLSPNEPGWPSWADGIGLSWKESIGLEGSKFMGYFANILRGYDITDIERSHDLAEGKLLLSHPGKLYICYLPEGGTVNIKGVEQNIAYKWYDPRTGEAQWQLMTLGESFEAPDNNPWVLIIGEKKFN